MLGIDKRGYSAREKCDIGDVLIEYDEQKRKNEVEMLENLDIAYTAMQVCCHRAWNALNKNKPNEMKKIAKISAAYCLRIMNAI